MADVSRPRPVGSTERAKLRVAHLSSVHEPFDTRIFYKECAALAAAGHDVSLVAPYEGDVEDSLVHVHPITPRRGRLNRMTRTVCEVYRTARKLDADVYHFHDPELIPVGLLLKWRGKHVVYDAHEDLPRQMRSKYWIPRWLRGPLAIVVELLERPAARWFDAVVAATPSIARRFPAALTVVVRNYPIATEFASVAGEGYDARAQTVVYVGAITEPRGARQMVAAMGCLPQRFDALLELVGTFTPTLLEGELVLEDAWSRVVYHGYQKRDGVASVLSRARLGLVVLQPRPNYLEALPVKLFEYMAAGIPCVVSDFPLWREIVESAQCGLLVDPSDPEAIAAAIAWLLENESEAKAMGERGREAVESEYNWQGEAKKLVELYAKLTGEPAAG